MKTTPLEAWKRLRGNPSYYQEDWVKLADLELVEKSLKALEIIKEKNIDVYWLKTSPNLSRYNLAVGTNQALKKEEYDLLKEVLL